MARQGRIPVNLVIYSRAADTWNLDAMWDRSYRDPDKIAHTVKGRKAFAVDKDSKNAPTTASNWADAKPMKARSKLAVLFEEQGDTVEERPNDPMTGLRIFHLEIRQEGGRAYKVITEEGYIYDMREDVVMEALMNCGIKKGGYIGGKYIFGILGSQIRLVRVGSQLHKDLIESTKRKSLKKVTNKDLKVGYGYQTKSGEWGVFLGFVHSHGDKRKRSLWYKPYNWQATNFEGLIETLANDKTEGFGEFRYELKQSHSFVMEGGEVPAKVRPSIENCREVCEAGLQTHFAEWAGRRFRGGSFNQHMGDTTYLRKATVVPVGETPVITPTVQDIIDRKNRLEAAV